MSVSDDHRSAAADVRAVQDPEPPPVAPDDRPTIEPDDAVPSDDAGRPGLLHEVTSSGDAHEAGSGTSADSAREPSPPPVAPGDRPTIEPADARPTDA